MKKNIKNEVTIIVHLLGLGDCVEYSRTALEASEEIVNLPPEDLVDLYVMKTINRNGAFFSYLDCIKESYIRGEHKCATLYIRYVFDVERENFKDFLKTLRPSDFLTPNR